MKKFLLPLLLFIIPQILFAQMSKKEQNNELRSHAKEIRWQGQMGTPALLTFRDDFNMTREQAIEYSKSFCAAENVDFKLKNQQTGKDGKNLYRYVQTIAGYPVEFSAWHIHEKNGSVTAVNGDIVDIQNFDITFSITEEDALKAALNYIGAELYMWMDAGEEQNIKDFYNDETATYYPEGIKIITPVHPDIKINKFRTAYKFNIYSKKPYTRKMVYVDAQTGEILFDLPLIHFENAVGTAHTQYSGIREINTYNTGSQYILQDNTRGNGIKTLNCQNGINYYAAVNFTDDDNIWNNENPQMDEYATDAHFSTMSTYDYYFNVHNRNSIDGNGYALASYVHFNLIEYGYGNNVNAFWNGQYMTYGDGDLSQGITPLTTLDICGHEITHGLTTFTADLTYAYESGALNESFSDIFGTSIEFYAVPNDANWTMGEKMGKTFRSMSNPKAYNNPNTYKGQFWEFSGYDNGGVHINSGVLNYWFYLICEGGSGVNDNGHAYQVQGIGLEKAEQIAFKTLTEYLTPSSQYIDVYYSAIIASGELFGGCSPEIQAVGDAFYAVGVITEPFLATTSADFKASAIVLTTLPAQVTFTNKSTNGITYLWDFGDGTTSTESNPVHVYTEEGNYSVTLSVYGGACGSDIITKEQYIKISTSYISVTMPINSHITKEACAGVVYDAGGPNGNYPKNANSRLTIYAPGATSIVLTIEEFDIEAGSGSSCNYDYIAFYDGNSISAPLINGTTYCNTNGNPKTIASTGEYITIRFISDSGVELSGYAISFQCQPAEPKAHFSVNPKTSCTGFVDFLDNSSNSPTKWQWDFGDGSSSSMQNPKHKYSQNGTYSVSLTVSNEAGTDTLKKENLITVNVLEAPEISNIKGCNNYEFEIAPDLEGTAYWYANDTDEVPLYIGNKWVHDPIQNDITYFLREVIPTGIAGDSCKSPATQVLIISEICLSVNQYCIEKIVIAPNPSQGLFYLNGLTTGIDYKYIVTDIAGKIIIDYQPIVSDLIDLRAYANGVYFVRISTSNSQRTYKLINHKP